MRITFSRTAGAALAAGLAVVLAAGSALAAPPSPAPAAPSTETARCLRPAEGDGAGAAAALRSFGDCEIDRRLAFLGRLSTAVAGSKALTSEHRSALSAEIAGSTAGLTSLRAAIDGETDLAALRADVGRIATDYRVYLLVGPKARLVMAADRLSVGYDRFEKVETRLADAIAKAKGAGKDVGAAQAAFDAMTGKVDRAETLLGPVATSILPLTPADWNAGSARPVLRDARSSLREVGRLFADARADARACASALRGLR